MNIKDFKLRKNRQRPSLCYGYEKHEGDKKYMIFTIDSGRTFLATIEHKRSDKRFYQEFNKTCSSVNECLAAFDIYNKDNK